MRKAYYEPFITDQSPEDEIFYVIESFGDKSFPQDKYLISNYGRVFSFYSGKYLTPIMNSYGYYYVSLGANRREFIHRLVAMAFVPGYSETRNCVNHKDGNKINNYYKNLEWCSKAENNRHAYDTHLNNYIGENCRDAKLTNEQVHQICALLEKGMSIKNILHFMGMEYTMNNYEIIRSIRKGYAWKSISKDYNVGYTAYRYDSISDEQARKICECLVKGMSVSEIYETVFMKPYEGRSKCDKYNIIQNIRNRRSFGHITKDYEY